MPRGKRKQKLIKKLSAGRQTLIKQPVILLLGKFLLIKLGSLPILVIRLIIIAASNVFLGIHQSSFRGAKPRQRRAKRRRNLSFISRAFLRIKIATVRRDVGPRNDGYKRGRPKKQTSNLPSLSLNLFILPKFSMPKFSFSHLALLKPRTRGRPKKFRIPRPSLRASFLIILTLGFLYTYFIFKIANQLPAPDRLLSSQPLTTEFYDRNGKLLYRLYEDRNRSLVKLSELPPHLINATIAIEDKNFYKHSGVDPIAVARALHTNWKNHQQLQGGSTITQQLIKNSLLTPERTYTRKIKEVLLAFWTERVYSKEDILQMYFNEVPYGGPAWGIEAASRMYFGKTARNLTLAESAYLAGLPASPTEYSPYGTTPTLGYERQKEVLKQMVEEGHITRQEGDTAALEKVTIRPFANEINAPHFVMFTKDFLSRKYGSRLVSQGGLKIYTTVDLELQESVQRIVSEEVGKLAHLNVKNGAAMVTDVRTGQILAMVGSKDYNEPNFGNFNVTVALRQPGSSIKPVTYSSAFKKGYSPGNTILDTPVVFKDNWGNAYAPVNYDGKFHGPVSIRTALGSSYNIPAVKLIATVGVDDVIDTATDLGITTYTEKDRYGLSLTLGGGEVKMVDMMSVYGVFSQLGTKKTPTPILKVADSYGNVLEEYRDQGTLVLQPEIAYLITNILSDNNARTPAFGPNSLLNIPGQYVAVKTGTSDNKRDNWTFGYTNDNVVGVWVGNPDNTPMDPSLTSGVTGAAPIWNRITRGLLSLNASTPFEKPSGIAEGFVDGRKDLIATSIVPKGLVRVNKDKDKITFFDSFSSYATSSAIISARDNLSN